MSNEEWEPVVTADTVEEKIREFARLARTRADERDEDIESVVHDLTHESYLLKHTTSDVLRELREPHATETTRMMWHNELAHADGDVFIYTPSPSVDS